MWWRFASGPTRPAFYFLLDADKVLRDRLKSLCRSLVRRVVLHLPTATPDLHAWRHIALALGARPG